MVMTLAQTIFVKAREAAAELAGDFSPHELDTKRLDAFKAQGQNVADYPEWRAAFNQKRDSIRLEKQLEDQRMGQLANAKAASELIKSPSVAASVPGTDTTI